MYNNIISNPFENVLYYKKYFFFTFISVIVGTMDKDYMVKLRT